MGEQESIDVRLVRLEERDRAEEKWRESIDAKLANVEAGIASINLKLAAGEGKSTARADILSRVLAGGALIAGLVALYEKLLGKV